MAQCDAGSGSHPLHQWRLNGSCQQCLQRFSRAQLKHGLTVSLLHLAQLLFVLGVNVERVGPQRILHAPLGVIHPALDLGGVRSNDRLASETVVLPWMISMTSAVLRFAIQRLMLSFIVILMASLLHYSLSRKSVGRYNAGMIRVLQVAGCRLGQAGYD